MPDQIDPQTAQEAYNEALKRIQNAINNNATGLILNDLSLLKLPPEIGNCANLQVLKVSTERTLSSSCRLKMLPPEIGRLSNLQRLFLGDNDLIQLPLEIGELSNLTELYLSNNNLAELPNRIGKLSKLEVLDVSNNQITILTPEIGQLFKLARLYLSKNSITEIPPEIGQLVELTVLYLDNNDLIELPFEICKLFKLMELNLRQNRLIELPTEIGKLTQLRTLDLRENQLNRLPIEINELSKLRWFALRNNPELPISPEILQRGQRDPQLIIDFWQEFLSQKLQLLHEVKMILVGEGSVGKTSLVRRLTADEFDQGEKQTKGIHIEEWPVQVSRKLPVTSKNSKYHEVSSHIVKAHIWDFGGQEIMHATHQFFLTDRSLYVLVLDVRKGERESRVEYWLSLIESFAGESPIIIVLNKCDQHFLELNRRGLLKKHPNIAGFVRTSAATGKGLAEFKQTISDTIATMPHVDTPFPQTWFNVKERLEALAKDLNFLLYDTYKCICQEEEVVEDSKQRTLIRLLHDLGIVLNFQDDARVRDTSILNPEWVTQGVYSLLNQEQLAKQGGVLESQQLADLLDGELYPLERQGFILHMMEKFELAYPFDGGSRYLIPDLLPVEEPEFEWTDSQSLHFAYHYDVLPYSILHRFMVRQHMRICEQVQWRTGVMLHHDGLQALIKADIEDGVISIAINGEGRRREFLSNLRFTFESLHQYITGVQPKEMVPIPGHPEVEPVPYKYLLRLEEKRVEEALFPGMDDFVNVRWLLDGIESRRQLSREELLEIVHQNFSKDELKRLIVTLGVTPDDFDDEARGNFALEFVLYMERRGRMIELEEAVREKRPFLFE